MPKPETDPETIEQALTRLENRIIDRFSSNAPGDLQTAIAAEEKPAEVVKTTASSFTRRSGPLPSSPGWPEWTLTWYTAGLNLQSKNLNSQTRL